MNKSCLHMRFYLRIFSLGKNHHLDRLLDNFSWFKKPSEGGSAPLHSPMGPVSMAAMECGTTAPLFFRLFLDLAASSADMDCEEEETATPIAEGKALPSATAGSANPCGG